MKAPAEVKAAPAQTKVASAAAKSSVRAAKTQAATVQPTAQATDTANSDDANSGPITALRLVFGEESWTEIADKNGKLISSKIHPAGTEFNLRAHLPLSLVIGHAASARLFEDGQPVDLTPFINSYSEVARITLE